MVAYLDVVLDVCLVELVDAHALNFFDSVRVLMLVDNSCASLRQPILRQGASYGVRLRCVYRTDPSLSLANDSRLVGRGADTDACVEDEEDDGAASTLLCAAGPRS